MKKIQIGVLAALIALLPALGMSASSFTSMTFSSAEDPSDAANFTYCAQRGVWPGTGTITAAASATLTVNSPGNTNGISVDADVGEGSEIIFLNDAGTLVRRTATSKTAGTIVISGAVVTVTAGTYTYSQVDCGTGAENGWIDVSGYDAITVQTIVAVKGAATIDMVIEGRMGVSTTSTVIFPKTYAAVGSDHIVITETVQQLRVGWKPSGAATDSVSAFVGLRKY